MRAMFSNGFSGPTNADLSPVLNLNMSPAVLAGNSHFIYLFPLFWNYSGSPDMKNVIESMAHGPTCGRRFNENIAFLLRIRVKTLLCFKLRPRTEEKHCSTDVAFLVVGG